MTADNPFLAAILHDPTDDLARLAYSDWIEEQGDAARAEFVRIQVTLAAGVLDQDSRFALERRQAELLFAHESDWVAPLAAALEMPVGRWGGWVFRRGFIEYFNIPAATLVRFGHRLATLTPIRELYLRPTESNDVARLVKQPWMSHVWYLDLNGCRLSARTTTAMVTSPFLGSLRKLRGVTVSHARADAFRQRFPAEMTSVGR